MANTPNPGLQNNAYQALNDYAQVAQQAWNLLATLADLKQREATHAYSEIYKNTSTYETNPDGTPGNADPAPVLDHPMEGTYLSHDDVSGFVGYVVNDLYDLLTGAAAPAQADRRPAIKGMLP